MTKDLDEIVKSIQEKIDEQDLRDFSQKALSLAENPYKMGILEGKNIISEQYRSSCGDLLTLYVDIQNNIIDDISFELNGCFTSKIAASQMVKMVYKKSLEEALNLTSKEQLW